MIKPQITKDQADALRAISAKLGDTSAGLAEPVFNFALAIVPMINVDLLVEDEARRVLLAWRADYFGTGWHVPGGIVRRGEALEERLQRTAETELRSSVLWEPEPIAITQTLGKRGHFISLLYKCRLEKSLTPTTDVDPARLRSGDLSWFSEAPDQRYPAHDDYIRRLPAFARPGGSLGLQSTFSRVE